MNSNTSLMQNTDLLISQIAESINAFTGDEAADDILELDVQSELVANEAEIEALVRAEVGVGIEHCIGATTAARNLAVRCLDMFYASGSLAVIAKFRAIIREVSAPYKDTEYKLSLLSDFNRAVRYGLGELVNTGRVDKQGNALYALDKSQSCLVFDEEMRKYVVRSKNVRKAVGRRYYSDLRNVNLVRPRMFRDFEKRSEKKGVKDIPDAVRKLCKGFDDKATAILEQFATQISVALIEQARDFANRQKTA